MNHSDFYCPCGLFPSTVDGEPLNCECKNIHRVRLAAFAKGVSSKVAKALNLEMGLKKLTNFFNRFCGSLLK